MRKIQLMFSFTNIIMTDSAQSILDGIQIKSQQLSDYYGRKELSKIEKD